MAYFVETAANYAMPNTVTNRQMAFILLLSLTAFSIVKIPQQMARSAGTNNWITLLLAGMTFAFLAWSWSRLNNRYPGKMLFDYSRDIVGRAGAYLLSSYFAMYFLTVLVHLDMSMSQLLKSNFLPETPEWATSLISLPVLGYVAYKGVTNVARLVEIYGVIFLLIAVTVHIMMLMQGDVMQILPLFNPAELGWAVAAVKDAVFPFLGVELLAVFPFTNKNGPRANKTAFLTLLSICLFYILIVESSIMMIGLHEIVHYNFPLVSAIRQVELPALKVLQRLDLLYLTVGFIGLFGGLSVVYLAIVEFLCRMLPRLNRGYVVAAVAVAVFVAGISLKGIRDIMTSLTYLLTYLGVFTAGIVPLTLLAVSRVRKHGLQADR
jgi:spore germination protein (amino acid permease)